MSYDENNVRKLLKSFANSPGDYWQLNTRQSKKSSNRIRRLLNCYGWSVESSVEIILCLAKERIRNNVKTIYLSSFGSSGSHLLQHVMVDSLGMVGLGEVYLPQPIDRALKEADLESRQMLLECYHLLHSPPDNLFKKSPMINTAHRARLQTFSSSTAAYTPVFIVRDPVNLAVSRSFRKGEYRSYLGKGDVSDEDYFKENVEKTKRFYQGALEHPYDYYLFFEDIHDDRDKLAETLSFISGDSCNKSKILEAVDEALKTGVTNKYDGPETIVSERLVSWAKDELAEVSSRIEELRIIDRLNRS